MPTYSIATLGCKLNQADSAAIEARLRAAGLTRAGGDAADVVLLNTCTVTAGADREARQIARRLRRLNPRATLIATGCYAERDGAALAAAAGIDHVVGMRDQAARVAALAAAAAGLEAPAPEGAAGPFGATAACDPDGGASNRTRVYLKIQDGCDLRCSYCIIPKVRGASRSLAPEAVLERIDALGAAGRREIVLTGVNTGDYGRDLDPPTRLEDLLRRAVRRPGLGRLRLNSLEPKTVTPGIVDLLARGHRLARHLQVPLQSGCDTVLARMRRPYRVAAYARLVERLRDRAPSIGLGADVIAGFPGETDNEFEATFRFIASSPLNYLHVFSFSPRPGTTAARLPGQVPRAAISERGARLRGLGAALSLRFRRSFVGRTVQALTLRALLPDGRLRALSDNFIDLALDLEGRPAGAFMNRLLPARITGAGPDHTLARLAP